MPLRPLKNCKQSGCNKLTSGTYCEDHIKIHRKGKEDRRLSSYERGYNSSWRKKRAYKLKVDPLCERCFREGLVTAATLVHHIDYNPKNNAWENLESLCGVTKTNKIKGCHDEEHKEDRFKHHK